MLVNGKHGSCCASRRRRLRSHRWVLFLTFNLLCGCSQLPSGPSVAVMPAPGKPFDVFVSEDRICREFAERQAGISPAQAANQGIASGAVAGTAIGAAAGTAVGAAVGSVGPGAVVGAGAGLIEGSAIGANNGYSGSWSVQRRYDIAFEQCMYAKGNQLPGYAGIASTSIPATYPAAYPPPPPYR